MGHGQDIGTLASAIRDCAGRKQRPHQSGSSGRRSDQGEKAAALDIRYPTEITADQGRPALSNLRRKQEKVLSFLAALSLPLVSSQRLLLNPFPPTLYPAGQISGQHGSGDESALGKIASSAAQKVPIIAVLDPFRHHLHA